MLIKRFIEQHRNLQMYPFGKCPIVCITVKGIT